MIDRASARALIVDYLAAVPAPQPGDGWVILDDNTMERDWGWMFFYDSRRHQETGESQFIIAGNAPFFVRRSDGAVFVSGTGLAVEDYIKDFEAGGRLIRRCSEAGAS